MFRRVLTVLVLAAVLLPAAAVGPREEETEAQACTFTLGFGVLRNMIIAQYGDIVGQCLENEWHNPTNGDGLQQTTGGLMVWRKCDNWTAFTNGSTTWLNGPGGLAVRPNAGPLLPFEAASCPGQPVAPPPAPPAPPPPPPPGPTSTPIPGNAKPTISIRVSEDRPRQDEEFVIRLEATDDNGVQSMWWWATSTDDNDLRDTETQDCEGATPCIETWTVSTDDEGEIILHAQSRDTNGQLSDEVTREIRVREREDTPTPTPTRTPTRTPTP
jgi:hypothetical protein